MCTIMHDSARLVFASPSKIWISARLHDVFDPGDSAVGAKTMIFGVLCAWKRPRSERFRIRSTGKMLVPVRLPYSSPLCTLNNRVEWASGRGFQGLLSDQEGSNA